MGDSDRKYSVSDSEYDNRNYSDSSESDNETRIVRSYRKKSQVFT